MLRGVSSPAVDDLPLVELLFAVLRVDLRLLLEVETVGCTGVSGAAADSFRSLDDLLGTTVRLS